MCLTDPPPPLPPSAVIEFFESSEARAAFSSLAYTRFKNGPLYLEWAPADALGEAVVKKQDDETGQSGGDTATSERWCGHWRLLGDVWQRLMLQVVDCQLFVCFRLCYS